MKLSESLAIVNIGEKRFAMVPVSDMRVDNGYQRVLKPRVEKMKAHWDYDKCDVLVTSWRDGCFYIVDGQHRYEAAKANGVQFLACQIIEGLSRKDEARKFLAQNTEACSLTPYDTWNANLLIGDPIDCAIDKLCREFSVRVDGTQGIKDAAVLGSLTEARNIVRVHGAPALRWMLEVLHAAKWDEVRRGHNSSIMRALRAFYAAHINDLFLYSDRIKCLLHKNDPLKLQAKAVAAFSECDVGTAVSRFLDYAVTGEPSESVADEDIVAA